MNDDDKKWAWENMHGAGGRFETDEQRRERYKQHERDDQARRERFRKADEDAYPNHPPGCPGL